MNDEELIGYCEIHCTTPRALFNEEQINRMTKLARLDLAPIEKGWYSMHEEMETLCKRARKYRNFTVIDGGKDVEQKA